MTDFIIHFLISNLFISGIIGLLMAVKHLFRNSLSGRMQYHLWFLLLGLLTVPFIPLRSVRFSRIFSRLAFFQNFSVSYTGNAARERMTANPAENMDWLNDFTLSVSSSTSSITGNILLGIWIAGILVMVVFLAKAFLRLQNLKQSALPLQHPQIRRLYHECLHEMKITKNIPIYSTAFLKSPVIVGLLRPRIYFPIHLISDYDENETEIKNTQKPSCNPYRLETSGLRPIRYMLLHELQHYRHKDALANYLIVLARIIYWFNPIVWLALREMQCDREVACDTSVLNMLDGDSYGDYGNTLISFAEKISHASIPFAVNLSGTMTQMKRRIMNIAAYETPTLKKKLKGMAAFLLTSVLLISLAPILSTYAAEDIHYRWKSSSKNVTSLDLSSYFGEYEGSFVLYNLEQDAWGIYDIEHASLRRSPDSTYKMYDALFGLEEGIITPEDSKMEWDGENYPFKEWNADQTLTSAMRSSVNWYFQGIDKQLGSASVKNYIQKIGYGNENTEAGLPFYWLESSLKISPIEQVEQLVRLYNNAFGFQPENVEAVKDSICLSLSEAGTIYGKTGTGSIDDSNVNGWFVGYVETAGNTYFFAANIGAGADASGANAAEITMAVLSDMNIWK